MGESKREARIVDQTSTKKVDAVLQMLGVRNNVPEKVVDLQGHRSPGEWWYYS